MCFWIHWPNVVLLEAGRQLSMGTKSEDYVLDKQRVSRAFSAAAQHYHCVDQLQQTVAERLLERLDYTKLQPALALDLGSGPGISSARLAKYYKNAVVIETDISWSMLLQSKKSAPRFFSRRRRFCSDAENLGIKSNSVDLVFSNLMLQWCDRLDLVFNEVRRVLRPNSLFIFSSFGPDTLIELRKSWQAVDEHIHVNAFSDMHDVGDALVRAGMENPVLETENIIVKYDDVKNLMRELKLLGAHNVNVGRRKTLTGKGRLQGMLNQYEKRRHEGKLPATYEVIYGHAWTPAIEKARRVDAQTLAFPLSALKRVNKQ